MADDSAVPRMDLDRIATDPTVLLGKPVVKGTRIPVTLILNLIANGYSFARIVEAYPLLDENDVRAAVAYAQARLEEDARTVAAPG